MDSLPPDADPWSTAWWAEVEARADAATAAELGAEAAEVFVAEAARLRLADRRGPARVTLRCGVVLSGDLVAGDRVADHLCLRRAAGDTVLVRVPAVRQVTGPGVALRDEDAGAEARLTAWLREAWLSGEPVRALDAEGRWWSGPLLLVGADHAEVDTPDGPVILPLVAVEAWGR